MKRLRIYRIAPAWVGVWACLAIAGCGPASTIYTGSRGFLAASVTPKSMWRAFGDVIDPAAAVDGNVGTAATSGREYTGHAVTIDLGKACLFQTVIIEHGRSDLGYARTVEVATSTHGSGFQTKYTTHGTRRATIISLPRPVLARYLRLRAVRADDRPWSLAEVYIQ